MEPQSLMRLATVVSTSMALILVGAKAAAWIITHVDGGDDRAKP